MLQTSMSRGIEADHCRSVSGVPTPSLSLSICPSCSRVGDVPGQYRTSLRTIRPIAPTFVIGEQPESHGPPIIAASFSNTGWQGMMFAFEHPPLVVSANVADYDQNEIHYSRLMVSTLIESRSPQGVEMDTRLEMDSSRLQKYSGRSEGDALVDSLR